MRVQERLVGVAEQIQGIFKDWGSLFLAKTSLSIEGMSNIYVV